MHQSKLKFISKENEINRLIKGQRFSGKSEFILFTSMWDTVSNTLIKKLEKKIPKLSLHILNSFDTPHSFVIWGVTSVPSLVIVEGKGRDKRVTRTSHVTDIYKKLRLERR